jgi:hypothetical protein
MKPWKGWAIADRKTCALVNGLLEQTPALFRTRREAAAQLRVGITVDPTTHRVVRVTVSA